MDWLRRNWPDLIIGVALVAVVSLIVVTLLSGGSLASLVRRGNPPELAVTNTTPQNNQTPAATNSGASNTDAGTNAPNAGTNTANAADGGVDVFVPGVPGGRPDAVPNTPAGQTQAGAQTNSGGVPPGQAATTSGGAAQSAATPADTGPLPDATSDGGFRVAAGAVDSRDAAVGLAESYRDAGYTVTVEQQNNLYLLWIGPYATRAGAERVANRLIADNVISDALVYTYSGPDGAANNSASNSGTSNTGNAAAAGNNAPNSTPNNAPSGNETANAGSSPANAAPPPAANSGAGANANATAAVPTNPATATGQRYLQVGAFASDESAQPLREQLGALGFNVTQSVSDSGLVRLLVGPFGAAQLTQAQTRLAAQGVSDAFPVIP